MKHNDIMKTFALGVFPIILICTALYIYFDITSMVNIGTTLTIKSFYENLLLQPPYALFNESLPKVQFLWMFITYSFVHTDYVHLIVNMLFLTVLGATLARKIDGTGIIIIYIGSSIFAAIVSMVIPPASYLAGSSCAIYGLMGAILYWDWIDHRKTRRHYHLIALAETALIIFVNIVYFTSESDTASWQAHTGAFFAGIFYATKLPRARHYPNHHDIRQPLPM